MCCIHGIKITESYYLWVREVVLEMGAPYPIMISVNDKFVWIRWYREWEATVVPTA